MKFYDRKKELSILQKADRLKKKQSVLTVLIGRRRVGKTTLALQNFSSDAVVYFFVSKKSQKLLCQEFAEELKEKLDVKIHGSIDNFEALFAYIMDLAYEKSFTLIIDEFQEFYKTDATIYSSMQKQWDLHKAGTRMHLITCGSIYSLMKKIYEDQKEPLFGRADFKINLKPLEVDILKEILHDHDAYCPKNLIDFYTITGGMAKYIELFVLHEAFDFERMIDQIVDENSLFLDEGKNRLIEEFGKDYGVYFSILSLIASSKTASSQIESVLQINVSGYLRRLEHDYGIIQSLKPVGSKPNAKVKKYEIVDNFLSFWFRFIYKYQTMIEAHNYERLKTIIYRDFDTFKGKFLEKLFMQQLRKKQQYTQLGSYWERGNKNEIDIVGIDDIDKKILFCEVKLNEKKLSYELLVAKSQKLLQKYKGYSPEYRLLSLKDIKFM